MSYTIDFETNNHVDDCHIWVWGICHIETLKFYWGTTWNELFEFWKEHGNQTYYFHNLKFDGEFIISKCLTDGWEHTNDSQLDKNQFTTLISNKGVFYSIKLAIESKRKKLSTINILDSLKLINSSVKKIAKDFKLPIKKGKIDYNKQRPIGYIPTREEIEYLQNDVEIMARALKIFFKSSHDKMTIASNALADYKSIIGNKAFNRLFPELPYNIDKDIRQAYKGGWTYLKQGYSHKIVGKGQVFDVNGLYYHVMHEYSFPVGEPKFFNGKYKYDPVFPLYVQMFTCQFELKKDYLPTLQIKQNFNFIPTEYATTSNGEDVTLCLTNIDLELFLEHYEVTNRVYHSGWCFRAKAGLFTEYVDKWVKVKVDSEKEGNGAERSVAKMYLTNLYGKFGKHPQVASKIPYLKENGIVGYHPTDPEIKKGIYIPLACFVTAYARRITITSAQKNYDRFIYSDTDSIHLEGWEEPADIKVDKYELGAWKMEGKFVKAKFLRAKSYMEKILDDDGATHLKVTCAGMPKDALIIQEPDGTERGITEEDGIITFENFNFGMEVTGGLKARRVKGGVVLMDSPFTIKSN